MLMGWGAILFFFNPEHFVWFPKCPFYLMTGYQCPACGIQRAIYQLLHLNFQEAFDYNLFLVISVPYALLLIMVNWFDASETLKKIRTYTHHPITIKIYLVLMIMWWIYRNIELIV